MISLGRQLRDFGFGAALALLIASVAFVVVRNTALVRAQRELAIRAARGLADGREVPNVRAVIVDAGAPLPSRPYLMRRDVFEHGAWRPLVAGQHPDDKLIYDAANRADRKVRRAGPRSIAPSDAEVDRKVRRAGPRSEAGLHVELLPDGSGRVVAVEAIADDTGEPRRGRLAIAVTPPASPASYPWLVMIGVLGLGASFAAAGALAGGRAGRGAQLGLALGVSALAIPCALWGSWLAAGVIVGLGCALALAQRRRLTDRLAGGVRAHRAALGFLAPAAISMLVLVASPFVIGLVLGFYDHHHGTWSFVGLSNFTEILSGGGNPLDDPLNFWFILGVTVLWTVANVALHVSIGVALALLLSRTWMRGKGVFRMLLILPWAIPNYITALIWHGMYEGSYGAINSLLDAAGLEGVSWFGSWTAAFSANVIANTWLGFPFMMVVALGALETIPKDLYEAASVDGASAWQRFRHITLPHLRPALGPAVALGSIWTFNQFNVIYLVSGGAPGGSTNILVTDAYAWAFERGERYGMAAAYATIIFGILLLWNTLGARILRAKEAT